MYSRQAADKSPEVTPRCGDFGGGEWGELEFGNSPRDYSSKCLTLSEEQLLHLEGTERLDRVAIGGHIRRGQLIVSVAAPKTSLLT